jgi:hypothetical protein
MKLFRYLVPRNTASGAHPIEIPQRHDEYQREHKIRFPQNIAIAIFQFLDHALLLIDHPLLFIN